MPRPQTDCARRQSVRAIVVAKGHLAVDLNLDHRAGQSRLQRIHRSNGHVARRILDQLEIVAMPSQPQDLPGRIQPHLVAREPVRPHAGLVHANDQAGDLTLPVGQEHVDAHCAILERACSR